ncbi:MAG TPA: DUF2277 domain-containing protein [Candidatus Dormibacteraeota bacterium]|nr:DUF2277 domain-containing protein [Candidatus Dormibacteraeota bacterium]
MCRSIKVLRRSQGTPSEQELHEAALQFVRKISGYRVPSQANSAVFETAVRDVTASSRQLLAGLVSPLHGGRAPRANPVRPTRRRTSPARQQSA